MTNEEIKDLAEKMRVESDLWLLPEAWYDRPADHTAQVALVIDAVAAYLDGFDPERLESALLALAENCLAHDLATAETLHDES